jgi:hypothetical protein
MSSTGWITFFLATGVGAIYLPQVVIPEREFKNDYQKPIQLQFCRARQECAGNSQAAKAHSSLLL